MGAPLSHCCLVGLLTSLRALSRLRWCSPQKNKDSAAEVEERNRQKAKKMESMSLSIKEEKAALAEMARAAAEAKKLEAWDREMEDLKTKRALCAEQLRQAYALVDAHKSAQWREQTAQQFNLALGDLVEVRLAAEEPLQELLATPLWRARLQTECQVSAKMDRGAKRSVILCGSAEGVEAAKQLIGSLGEVRVLKKTLDEEQQGLLIGKKGVTIEKLQEETGCSLDVRRANSTLTIAGPADEVEKAAILIEELLKAQRRVEITLKFDPEQKGTLLGKAGSTINRIQQQSQGALMEVAKGDECTIRVWGPSAAVERARQSLVELLHLDAKSKEVLEVPTELLDHIIGRGGEHVKRLEAEQGVSIDILKATEKTEPSRIKFRGSVEGVKAAMKAIKEVLEREKKVEEVFMVESQHIGQLLGKSGERILSIQRATGAVLGVAKKPEQGVGSSKQAVTVKGNTSQVAKAFAMLEGVLQYNAECIEEMEVDARMMPQIIGQSGAEIYRIRAESGAAIDGMEKPEGASEAKPRLQLRGSRVAVDKAKQLIQKVIDSNAFVSENVVLPWHAIDELIGPNAVNLVKLEKDFSVQIELPGETLFLETAQVGTMFLAVASAMTLRGKKKFVDAAAAHVEALAAANASDELQLGDDDASLLTSICLDQPNFLVEFASRIGRCSVDFEPLQGLVTTRGEASLDAQIELRATLSRRRKAELLLDCPPTQAALLGAPDGVALAQLQGICNSFGCMVALQEDLGTRPEKICLFGGNAMLSEAAGVVEGWIAAHAAADAVVEVPPECQVPLRRELESMQRQFSVQLRLEDSSGMLHLHGPGKLVGLARDAAYAVVRLHAHAEQVLPLSVAEVQYVRLLLENAAKPAATAAAAAAAAAEAPPAAEAANGVHIELSGLFTGVMPSFRELKPAEAVEVKSSSSGAIELKLKPVEAGGAAFVMRGTAAPVEACKFRLETLLAEAKAVKVVLPTRPAAIDKLTHVRPAVSQKQSPPTLHKRLQDAYLVAIVIDRTENVLTLLGSAAAVAKVEKVLEEELDVDEHIRLVSERLIPVIIGRGGSNIKKLQDDSGANVSLERAGNRVVVRGRKSQVAKAVAMLDELTAGNGEKDVHVTSRQIPLIIGRGGEKIRQLQQESGAQLDVRKEDGLVRIRGNAAAVEKATQLVQALLTEGTNGQANGAAAKLPKPPPGLSGPAAAPSGGPPPPGLAGKLEK